MKLSIAGHRLPADRYFRTAEAAEPDFTAQAWLGEALVAEHRFQGRETKTVVTDIPPAASLVGASLSDQRSTATLHQCRIPTTGAGPQI